MGRKIVRSIIHLYIYTKSLFVKEPKRNKTNNLKTIMCVSLFPYNSRPKSMNDIASQEQVVNVLRKSLQSENVCFI